MSIAQDPLSLVPLAGTSGGAMTGGSGGKPPTKRIAVAARDGKVAPEAR